MTRTLIDYIRARSAPGAKRLGLTYRAAGISWRYRRYRSHWGHHLYTSQTLIREAVDRCPKDKPVLVLGAGSGYDLPLERLAAHPAGTDLVDAVSLPRLRTFLRRYDNLRFDLKDVTGLLARYAKAPKGAALDINDALPFDTSGYGLIISANMLSQIGLAFGAENNALIQQAHLKALIAAPCPVLCLTDSARHESDGAHESTIDSLEIRESLPDSFYRWQWPLVPYRSRRDPVQITLDMEAFWINTKAE